VSWAEIGPRFDARTRLRTRADIQAAFDHGHKLVNRQLVIWIRSRDEGPSRLGLSVSRKVGNAVTRNRVKRCLRNAWQRHVSLIPVAADVMVLARPGKAPMDAHQAAEALSHLLRTYARRSGPA
jgi:ribonuclease P protein component